MKPNRVKQLVLGAFTAVILMSGILTHTALGQTRVIPRGHSRVGRRPPRVIIYRPYYYNPFYNPFYDPFWGSPYWGPTYRTLDPIAWLQEQGFSKGRSKGKEDAKKGRPANPTGHKDYLKSNSLAYREAFVKGYNERYQEELVEMQEKLSEKGQKLREERGE